MTEPEFDLQPHAAGFATLVVHQLNMLFGEPCCADCCAPCAFVRKIAEDDTLEKIIALAPIHLHRHWIGVNGSGPGPEDTTDIHWADGQIDRAWLNSRWDCTSHPRCDTRDLDDPNPDGPDEFDGAAR